MSVASSGSDVARPMVVTVGADFVNSLVNSAKNAVSEGGGGGAVVGVGMVIAIPSVIASVGTMIVAASKPRNTTELLMVLARRLWSTSPTTTSPELTSENEKLRAMSMRYASVSDGGACSTRKNSARIRSMNKATNRYACLKPTLGASLIGLAMPKAMNKENNTMPKAILTQSAFSRMATVVAKLCTAKAMREAGIAST